MKNSHRLLALLAPLTLASALVAQPPRGGGGPRGGNPVMRVLDADKNHEISASEIAGAAAAIRTLDKNNDGAVSADELRPARPADAPERPAPPADAPVRTRPVDPVMLALDANVDGSLSSAEITNAPASLAALDANKDGKLSADEFRPLPPEGGKGGKRGDRS